MPPEVLREHLLAGSGDCSGWYFDFELDVPTAVRPLVGGRLCSEETSLTDSFLLFLVESGNDLMTSGPIERFFSFAFCMGNGKVQARISVSLLSTRLRGDGNKPVFWNSASLPQFQFSVSWAGCQSAGLKHPHPRADYVVVLVGTGGGG